jgi:hypothetical protein
MSDGSAFSSAYRFDFPFEKESHSLDSTSTVSFYQGSTPKGAAISSQM